MNQRRYREGRLVRARRLRRATLESERNLVLQRVGVIICSVTRFELMLAALRTWHQPAAKVEQVQGVTGCGATVEPEQSVT